MKPDIQLVCTRRCACARVALINDFLDQISKKNPASVLPHRYSRFTSLGPRRRDINLDWFLRDGRGVHDIVHIAELTRYECVSHEKIQSVVRKGVQTIASMMVLTKKCSRNWVERKRVKMLLRRQHLTWSFYLILFAALLLWRASLNE